MSTKYSLRSAARVENVFNEQVRLAILGAWLFVLCGLEFIIPLAKSSRATIFKTIPNLALTVILLLTNLVLAIGLNNLIHWNNSNGFGLFNWLGFDDWRAQLIAGIVFLDFLGAYLPHVLFHKTSWLWRFHSVHHSDMMVDVTTAFRQHPAETLVRVSFYAAGMVLLGLPLWVGLVYASLSAFNAQLEHSNIKVNSKLERVVQVIFVTPNLHKIHHSKYQMETDSNYSNIFSFWDRIFGTFTEIKQPGRIEYGLDYLKDRDYSLKELLFKIPFPLKNNS
jgi:sterol desaturase/sphingolipid hydroxylase (fatty acid hydroxylase superfamily)